MFQENILCNPINQDRLLEMRGTVETIIIISGISLKMEVFECELKGVRACGRLSGESFTVLNGSGAVGDDKLTGSFDLYGRTELRQELISSGTLVKDCDCYRFQKDYTFTGLFHSE